MGNSGEYCRRARQFKIITERELKVWTSHHRSKRRKISKQKLREEVFNIIYDNAVENVEKQFYFLVWLKFKSVLREWDQPTDPGAKKKDNLGANLHYISPNQRLKSLNNKQMPAALFHYYIPQRQTTFLWSWRDWCSAAESTPLDKFHRNR